MRRVRRLNDTARVSSPGTSMYITKEDCAEDGSCSVCQYDKAKLNEAKLQLILGTAIATFVHLKWGYTQPLLLMSIMQPFQLYENKAVQIHMLGRSGEGFERPWAAANADNPLAQWAERKKAEAEAEKAKKAD